MDVRMYDNGYVRLFSPPPRCDAFFPNALLPLFPPLKGGMGGCSSAFGIPCTRHNIIQLLIVNCYTGYIIHIHSGFQPSAEGVALFPNASLRYALG